MQEKNLVDRNVRKFEVIIIHNSHWNCLKEDSLRICDQISDFYDPMKRTAIKR
jgi:hypothetical protein